MPNPSMATPDIDASCQPSSIQRSSLRAEASLQATLSKIKKRVRLQTPM